MEDKIHSVNPPDSKKNAKKSILGGLWQEKKKSPDFIFLPQGGVVGRPKAPRQKKKNAAECQLCPKGRTLVRFAGFMMETMTGIQWEF